MSEPPVTYRGVVYPWQCDHMGHMNVTWYTSRFDEASWHFFATLGMTNSYFKSRTTGMAAVRQDIGYVHELHAGDLVTIRSVIKEITTKTIRFRHDMTNQETGELVATSELTGVYIDVSERKSIPLPKEVILRGQKAIGTQDTDFRSNESKLRRE